MKTKAELIKDLLGLAQRSSPRKSLNSLHVRTVVDGMLDEWRESLRETGTASFYGLGRFSVDKKTGTITFKASTLLEDEVFGKVSSSARGRGRGDNDAH